MRRELASYVSGYLQHGEAALVARDGRGGPIDLRQEWRSLFDRSKALGVLAPMLAPGLLDSTRAGYEAMNQALKRRAEAR